MVGKVTPDDIITASRIPALLGMSPYETPNDVLKKCIDAMEGKPRDEFKQNEAMGWGDRLEPIILTEAVNRLGLKDVKLDYDEAFFHPELTLACSLDGSAAGKGVLKTDVERGIYCIGSPTVDITGFGILEAKNTSVQPEETPAPYRGPLQLQAQMMCANANWGAVCVLYKGGELRIFVYQSDPQVQKRIADAIAEFEERKVNRDWYPPLTSADANTAYARGEDDLPPVDLSRWDNGEDLLDRLVAAKRAKAHAETEIDECEAGLKELMGAHTIAVGQAGNRMYQVRWPMRRTKAKPERISPATPEKIERQKTLTLKELD